ncbi:hypothetical protein ABTN31_19160, partial [Acinetobacter baumannii]
GTGNTVLLHDDSAAIGKGWAGRPGDLEFDQAVDATSRVRVALPSRVVTLAVADSAKNFLVLFFATAFIAAIAFQLGGALSRAIRLG